jgi:hypothetical protein
MQKVRVSQDNTSLVFIMFRLESENDNQKMRLTDRESSVESDSMCKCNYRNPKH